MKKTLYTETKLEDFGDGKKRRILSYNEDMMLVEVTFEQGGVGAAHSHPHRQISYVQSGLFVFACEGKEHKVGPGDSLLFKQRRGTFGEMPGRGRGSRLLHSLSAGLSLSDDGLCPWYWRNTREK